MAVYDLTEKVWNFRFGTWRGREGLLIFKPFNVVLSLLRRLWRVHLQSGTFPKNLYVAIFALPAHRSNFSLMLLWCAPNDDIWVSVRIEPRFVQWKSSSLPYPLSHGCCFYTLLLLLPYHSYNCWLWLDTGRQQRPRLRMASRGKEETRLSLINRVTRLEILTFEKYRDLETGVRVTEGH